MEGFVAVHTGVGMSLNPDLYSKVIKKSLINAKAVLLGGGTAVDACEMAIIHMENSGQTNAGTGSNLTWDGHVECEASLMNGTTLNFGAATNLTNVKNPISVARRLCDRQNDSLTLGRLPPMVLSGDGASVYAEEVGIPLVPPESLISRKAQRIYHKHKANIASYEMEHQTTVSPFDTVGAICVDRYGNCVAGCSSGGIILKVSGRVGQSATYGAGCWAVTDPTLSVATCTTGNGEYLMRTLMAKEICTGLSEDGGVPPAKNVHDTFQTKLLDSPFMRNKTEIYAGALSLAFYSEADRRHGDIVWAHTTPQFCLGYMTTHNRSPKFIFSELPVGTTPGTKTVANSSGFRL